ncbi:hypothetical protein [Alkalicoccus daliensis]|uniref:ZIP Zinc transporter n=1 Tax=Alkalicoccus daliensis TaxID=745820 RepID=A0A1H0J669_9BACI|nr:hypothetical protein [Alkalicoccus daliensis]SDO39003.1 hypothetical protein SAMN04488053_11281 [Alkalicoccus daliensis]
MFLILSFLCVLGFIAVHLFSERLTFLHTAPRSKVLSAAGGVSIAYVFMHLLPELHMFQDQLNEAGYELWVLDQYHVYLASLLGLVVFYGLERMAKKARTGSEKPEVESNWVFRVHVLSFFVYNFLIGYLIIHGEYQEPGDLLLYFAALSVHFISNDYSLRLHHEHQYDHFGRYMLAAAVFFGWLLALFIEVSEVTVTMLFSFLAGTMILNILKEELPAERESNFWAFGIGVLLYTLLLYAL